MNLTTTLTLILVAFCLSACSTTTPIIKYETKEVLIPTKCDLELPPKPRDDGSFESHKAIARYYKLAETIAKDCTKEGD